MKADSRFVTVWIGGQLFGLPVSAVHEIFMPQTITPVPLAPAEVAGVLNLRGRIVTVVDVRHRLGLAAADAERRLALVIEHYGELYSLLIDTVGDVLALEESALEPNPTNLDPNWAAVSAGVFRLEDGLLVVLEVDRILDSSQIARAA